MGHPVILLTLRLKWRLILTLNGLLLRSHSFPASKRAFCISSTSFQTNFSLMIVIGSKKIGCAICTKVYIRDLSRFFDCWAHETTYAYIGNKHFFTKSYHCQTYQNSKISWQKKPISDFQSEFSMSKIIRIFLFFFFHWRISI